MTAIRQSKAITAGRETWSERARRLRREHPEWSHRTIARKCGMTPKQLEEALARGKKRTRPDRAYVAQGVSIHADTWQAICEKAGRLEKSASYVLRLITDSWAEAQKKGSVAA